MALLLNDGFGLYNTNASALQVKGWTVAGTLAAANIAAGRTATSKFVSLNNARDMVQTLAGFSGATSVVGVLFGYLSGTLPADIISMSVGGSAVRLVVATISGATRLTLYRDAAQVADLGPISTAPTAYYYVEMKVSWAVAGNVTVRIDGTEYHNAAMTLAAPTAGLTVGLRSAFAGTGTIQYGDLLVMDGSGSTFNDFQGDVVIETLRPIGDGSTSAWARTANALTVTNKSLAANVASLRLGGTATGLVIGEQVSVAGVDATFDGVHTLTAVSLTGTETLIQYSKVAANVGSVASGGAVTSTDSGHWTTVDDPYPNGVGLVNNGDVDYVTTATVNAVDTYAMQDLSTSPSSPVLAVRPVLIARKESAAAMSIAPTVRSAGTNYPGTPRDLPNTLAYSAQSDTLTTDPATGSPWTRAAVDALEVGPKKMA